MPTVRNYRAEYRRRIARGLIRGLSRSQARGHPTAKERSVRQKPVVSDESLASAILGMNQGQSLTIAARDSHVSSDRLRRFLLQQRLGRKKGARWAIRDKRNRRVPVWTAGQQKTITVPDFATASVVGNHHNAAGHFVRTNDISHLKPFVGRSVKTAQGKRVPLETDPNELHRIAAMDNPPFHEIYEITSND